MLSELHIESLAIIDRLDVSFDRGLCVLTGETGAGKSIIVGGITAVLGRKLTADHIRHGADEARIDGAFDISDVPRAAAALAQVGQQPEADGTLVLSRSASISGKSRCRMNGRTVPASTLKSVGEALLDVCGQHEHQRLTQPEHHIEYLDAFGRGEVGEPLARFAAAFGVMQSVEAQLHGAQMDERQRAQRLDLLRFQVDEIGRLRLQPGEDRLLQQERLKLANAQRLIDGVLAARRAIGGDESDRVGAVTSLEAAATALHAIEALDPELTALRASVEQAAIAAQDAVSELATYEAHLESDPARLEETEARLDAIHRLRRKYGDTVDDILAFRDSAAAEVAQLERTEETTAELTAKLETARAQAGESAAELTEARLLAARRLETAMREQLAELAMDRAEFVVSVSQVESEDGAPLADGRRVWVGPLGADAVEFLFSANPGEPARPVGKVASGGELSRLMLALKSVQAGAEDVPVVIFDEIDAGIGASAADAIAKKLAAAARGRQVLCVTHLPQIACMADAHYAVAKAAGKRASVVVKRLEGEQRVAEIARMLGGSHPGEAGVRHAREMLAAADTAKRGQMASRAARPALTR